MTTTFDGGLTVMGRAGRVARDYRKLGVFQMMATELERHTAQHRPRVLYETTSHTERLDHFHDSLFLQGYMSVYRKGQISKALHLSNTWSSEIDLQGTHSTTDVHKMDQQAERPTTDIYKMEQWTTHSTTDVHKMGQHTAQPTTDVHKMDHHTIQTNLDNSEMDQSTTHPTAYGEEMGQHTIHSNIEVHELGQTDLSVLFEAEKSKARIFPEGRLFNFYLGYRLQDENIPAILCERGGGFYSMETGLENVHKDRNGNRNDIPVSQDSATVPKKTFNQSAESDPSKVFDTSKRGLKLNEAHRVAMATFYFCFPTRTGYVYAVDVYASPQQPASRDHLTRHLRHHIATARRHFPDKDGILTLGFDLHISRDIVESSLNEMGICSDFPGPKFQALYERSKLLPSDNVANGRYSSKL
ncbi:hypothetical protein ElyMa_006942600 [Elysia marginata]|uniref:Uncharacterized protein n=1 Tax=Elysia marginata TaxID=1093978 RepID=A0AAV4JIN5_9GAST|nr:hypothetical protein ElyMa_006942600 [Elysia marginata]